MSSKKFALVLIMIFLVDSFVCKPYFINTSKFIVPDYDEELECNSYKCIAAKLNTQIKNHTFFVVDDMTAESIIRADKCDESGRISKRQAEAVVAAGFTVPVLAANIIIALVVGVTVAVVTVFLSDYLQGRRDEDNRQFMLQLMVHEINRTHINCLGNNYGCLEGLCWTDCGPRSSIDTFCFTANPDPNQNKNIFLQVKDKNVTISQCDNDSQCHPCWPCATVCGK